MDYINIRFFFVPIYTIQINEGEKEIIIIPICGIVAERKLQLMRFSVFTPCPDLLSPNQLF
ncbi:hypothetical protein GWO43_26945 [candidate division KSB1 bacterium]|nr:hypothetical protein [candidate division KSB1 bacterium]NIR70195.1 hypothetical protein [candidate division KSB1 bacterium]NIS27582.1 hypothetical protein [candidate division KSB1 bacterium]NIT74434.1 hypothetical protein [candidate division KSB1 bacterium]NIU28299.1 hypothetical protein [candidate division KSB1 bacterium]